MKKFNLDKTKPIKLRKDVKTFEVDPAKFFRNDEKVISALTQCLKEGDQESFKDILSTYLLVINKEEFSRKSKIPIATLRRVTAGSNFNVDTLFKIFNAINKRRAAHSKKAS